jgi:hypothetical protein
MKIKKIHFIFLIAYAFCVNSYAANYLNFNLCQSFDKQFEEVRLSKENHKMELVEQSKDNRYVNYRIKNLEIFTGGIFTLTVTVFDGKLYKVSFDPMYNNRYSVDEYNVRMKKKYGAPKFLKKKQNDYAIDTWDVVYKYSINDKEVDVLVGESKWKSVANLYGFNFTGYGGGTVEYVCKDIDKKYTEYKISFEPENKKPDIKF